MIPTERHDPVPPSVRELLQLFETHLSDVRFPQVDRDVLATHAARVHLHAEELEARRAELDAARAALDDARDALVALAQRGLAYARVYAEGDPELGARLEGLALAPERAPAKKRRRKRSVPPSADVVELPLAGVG